MGGDGVADRPCGPATGAAGHDEAEVGLVRLRPGSAYAQLALAASSPLLPPPVDTDHELRVEADAICPRCLGWVSPVQVVRRTAYGLTQHEVCPAMPVDPVPVER